MRQVIMSPAEEGGYWAIVPSLPGCISHGETWEETIENIRHAIALYLNTLADENEPVPEDRLNRVIVVVDTT